MDPRDRADAALARARARGAYVVTPESAISPMDAMNTLQLPRSVVAAADSRPPDPERTMVIPGPAARGETQPLQPRPRGVNSNPNMQPVAEPSKPLTQYMPAPAPAEEPERPAPRADDGLIPTVHQPALQRQTLSQRLDGPRRPSRTERLDGNT